MSKKVFVSSPIRGMEYLRAAVKRACQSMGFDCVISEKSGSSPQSSLEWCLGNVRKSDLFILLLGSSYGWIPTNQNLSVTELEFNEAYKNRMPIFAYRIQCSDIESEQLKFIKRVEDFESGVFRGEKISNSDELEQRVILDVSRFLANLKLTKKNLRCPCCDGLGQIDPRQKIIYCGDCGIVFSLIEDISDD